jgi:hypothetical protein
MSFIFFVSIGVDVGAVALSARQVLALGGLKVESKDDKKLEGIENAEYNVDDHVAVVEPAESAPQDEAG